MLLKLKCVWLDSMKGLMNGEEEKKELSTKLV